MGPYLDVWWVEVHVVDPPTSRVDPAGAQAILQRLKGDVQADHQVQFTDPVQCLRLPQSPRETCVGPTRERGHQERQESSDGAKPTHPGAAKPVWLLTAAQSLVWKRGFHHMAARKNSSYSTSSQNTAHRSPWAHVFLQSRVCWRQGRGINDGILKQSPKETTCCVEMSNTLLLRRECIKDTVIK